MSTVTIEENEKRSRENRTLIKVLIGAVVVLIIAVVANILYSHHTMEECEARLFKKITGQNAPSSEHLKHTGQTPDHNGHKHQLY